MNKFTTTLLLLLTPLYLVLVYYKTFQGVDLSGLLLMSFVILTIYVPLGAAVTDYDVPVSIKSVLTYTNISKYLYLLFLFFGLILLLVNIQNIHLDYKLAKNLEPVIVLAIFIVWWFISGSLIKMLIEGSTITILKILFWVMFILALVIIDSIPPLPETVNGYYFFKLFLAIIEVTFFALLLVPQIGLRVFWGLIQGIILRQGFGVSKKNSSSLSWEDKIGGASYIVVFLALLYAMVFVPLINWFVSFTSSLDAHWISIFMTTLMILISAVGASFQVRLFLSFFWEDQKRIFKTTLIILALFYGTLIVSMNYFNKIEHNEQVIEKSQQKLEQFNEKVKESVRPANGY